MATMWVKDNKGHWRLATDAERDAAEFDMQAGGLSPNEFAAIRRKLQALEKRVKELEDQDRGVG